MNTILEHLGNYEAELLYFIERKDEEAFVWKAGNVNFNSMQNIMFVFEIMNFSQCIT